MSNLKLELNTANSRGAEVCKIIELKVANVGGHMI